jgi:hypothetical protein
MVHSWKHDTVCYAVVGAIRALSWATNFDLCVWSHWVDGIRANAAPSCFTTILTDPCKARVNFCLPGNGILADGWVCSLTRATVGTKLPSGVAIRACIRGANHIITRRLTQPSVTVRLADGLRLFHPASWRPAAMAFVHFRFRTLAVGVGIGAYVVRRCRKTECSCARCGRPSSNWNVCKGAIS